MFNNQILSYYNYKYAEEKKKYSLVGFLSNSFFFITSLIIFRLVLHYYLFFIYNFQCSEIILYYFSFYKNIYILSITRLSINFLLLASFIFPFIFLNISSSAFQKKNLAILKQSILVLLIEVFSVLIFLVQDIFSFLILYEIMLIPLMT